MYRQSKSSAATTESLVDIFNDYDADERKDIIKLAKKLRSEVKIMNPKTQLSLDGALEALLKIGVFIAENENATEE